MHLTTPLVYISISILTICNSQKQSKVPLKGVFRDCEHSKLSNDLNQLAKDFSNISRIYSIGKSNLDRDLLVMVLSDRPYERPIFRPQIKFVGNINGFSGPTCYLLVKFIKYILNGYGENEEIRLLLRSAEIHILPNMNPDGFKKSIPGKCDRLEGRMNAKGIELNRNFPDPFSSREDFSDLQPETNAIIQWISDNNFLLSVSYISGAIVVTYPFDSYPFDMTPLINEPSLTPDDDIFKHLASLYVHSTNGNPDEWVCPRLKRIFPGGITNGAEWSLISGTMQDYNYHQGTYEIMVGVSCCRNDNNLTRLENIWDMQRPAMIRMIQELDYSLRGQILEEDTGHPILDAKLTLKQESHEPGEIPRIRQLIINKRGEFWTFAPQGSYLLEVEMNGFEEQKFQINIDLIEPLPPFLIKLVEIQKNEISYENNDDDQFGQNVQNDEKEVNFDSIEDDLEFQGSTISNSKNETENDSLISKSSRILSDFFIILIVIFVF